MKDTPFPYGDILNRERPKSLRHAPMSMIDRGAQFSPFAALRGYDEVIEESSKFTEEQIFPAEERQAQIDRTLHRLLERLPEQPEASFTCIHYDTFGEYRGYRTVTGKVRRIDTANGVIVMTSGEQVPVELLTTIELI